MNRRNIVNLFIAFFILSFCYSVSADYPWEQKYTTNSVMNLNSINSGSGEEITPPRVEEIPTPMIIPLQNDAESLETNESSKNFSSTVKVFISPENPLFVEAENQSTRTLLSGTNTRHAKDGISSPLYYPDVKDVSMFGSRVETTFPSSYYAVVTPVKNQGPWGCWAFAAIASLESTLLPGENFDFSEKNMMNYAGKDNFDWGLSGNMITATSYLVRWDGPVLEKTDPYPTAPSWTWTSSSYYPPVKHVQNVYFLPLRSSPTANDNFKQALMTWGAIGSEFQFTDSTCYNSSSYAFYKPDSYSSNSEDNHVVTIIGWDDNFPASRFKTKPPGNGAWLVKNSWGSSYAMGGFFYISYYDKYFASRYTSTGHFNSAVVLGESTSNYQWIYQYDPLGETNSVAYGQGYTGAYANIFTASRNELIKAVGFYTTDVNVAYEVTIYKNPTSTPNTGTMVSTFSGTCPYMGYNTIPIPTGQQPTLNAGDKFAIIVRVTNPNNFYWCPLESKNSGYSSNATASLGQSYVDINGKSVFYDINAITTGNVNVCIKAYTKTVTPTVTGISPSTAPNTGSVSITNLAGTNFASPATVKLTKSGQSEITATDVNVVSSNQITCSLPVAGAAAGTWNVVVTTNDQTVTMVNGFTITVPISDGYEFVRSWGSNGFNIGQFDCIEGIAVDKKNNVYVADTGNNRIQKFSSNGKFIRKWGNYGSANGRFNSPAGIVVDKKFNLFVVDKGNNRIQEFNSNGKFIRKWGKYGSGNGQFKCPTGIAVDTKNNVYVVDSSNYRIQKFSSNGKFIRKWGSKGIGKNKFRFPLDIAIDTNNNVYVTDVDNKQIQKFTSNGKFIRKWKSCGTVIAVDKKNNGYVTDVKNKKIQKFTSNGKLLKTWSSEGTGAGQIKHTGGIDVDKNNNVYVADWDNNRICVFKPINSGSIQSVVEITPSPSVSSSFNAPDVTTPVSAIPKVEVPVQKNSGTGMVTPRSISSKISPAAISGKGMVSANQIQ